MWQLPVITQSGCSTWAITTPLDEGTHISWPALFPERSTGSAIDTERDDMAAQLKDSGSMSASAISRRDARHRSRRQLRDRRQVALLQQPGCTAISASSTIVLRLLDNVAKP